jgi:hypothetical protein
MVAKLEKIEKKGAVPKLRYHHSTCLEELKLKKKHPSLRISDVLSKILPAPVAPGPGVYSAANRNEYQKQKIMFLGRRVRPVRKADNLTAICEPTV